MCLPRRVRPVVGGGAPACLRRPGPALKMSSPPDCAPFQPPCCRCRRVSNSTTGHDAPLVGLAVMPDRGGVCGNRPAAGSSLSSATFPLCLVGGQDVVELGGAHAVAALLRELPEMFQML